MAQITINGKTYEAEAEARLLSKLRAEGIRVPSLCFHHALTPAAACKLCVVEIKEANLPPRSRLSCAVKIKDGMEITTESAMIYQLRNAAIGQLLKLAPHAEAIHEIGREFGLATGIKPDGCIRCRLCVRVCSQIIGAAALKMVRQGGVGYVLPSEEGRCIGCLTCVNVCPTGAILFEDSGKVRTIRIREEVIGRHALESCEICGRRFATTRFLEHVKKREGEHPEEKSAHVHCPTCAKLYYRKNLTITAPKLSKS